MMRRVFVFGLGFLLALAVTRTCAGQEPAKPLGGAAVVLVRPDVRLQLASAWDDSKVGDPERIYCLLYATDTTPKSRALVYTVFAALPAVIDSASVAGAFGKCPSKIPGFSITSLHTHPAFTCLGADGRSDCHAGGVWAWDCSFSDRDSLTFRQNGYPFALVQCDRNALVPYYAPPAVTKRKGPGKRWWFGTIAKDGVTVAAAFAAGRYLDPDAGGGKREYWAPDKAEHAAGGAALGATVGSRRGCEAAGAFELGQGFAEARDFVVTCGSAIVAARVMRWVF